MTNNRIIIGRLAPVTAAIAIGAFAALAWGAAPADLDRDGDVDQEDFGIFQACLTGPDAPQVDPACQVARLDDDLDVDQADFASFQPCISGSNHPATAACTPQAVRFFPRGSVWYQDISFAPADAQSPAVIAWLQSAGGWGYGRMQIDFSIEVLQADASAPFKTFTRTGDFYTPDCDYAPVPVPTVGALEGESGYQCVSDGDCHLIVVHEPSLRLYEMWRANITADGNFYGGCMAIWDMSRVYPAYGRGENCTSADAAGYPIAPLLFTADEVSAGWVDHAIRFILPNSRIRHGVYVHPATHSTGATSGGVNAPPYGARLRLRVDFPLDTLPNNAARVVARAMQRYGILLADGGNIALTARSDRFTQRKWAGLLGPHDLRSIQVTDFEMIDAGLRMTYTGDCERMP